MSRPRTLLILAQAYVPDPAASGQMMADAAAEMVRRGWRVVVLTSGRGYYDPTARYPARETINGVDVRRLPLSSFGTRVFALRVLAAILFTVQIIVRGLFVRRVDCILVSTAPPMCFVAALIIGLFRRVPIKFWVMDLSPDQLIALGRTTAKSLTSRVLNLFNRWMLRRAAHVVALDRFMGDLVNAKRDVREKLTISPPWPVENFVEPVAHEDNRFRTAHGLQGKFVFMYSGNHGLAVPLDTFLRAAVRLQDDDRVRFVFIGDGARKAEVVETIRANDLTNTIALPYQPLAELRYSLSAADVHLVSLGDAMVGVTHPSKIYGAMAVGRPILLLCPHPSHLSDIVEGSDIGWRVDHGDVDGMERIMRTVVAMPEAEVGAIGARARRLVIETFSRDVLCGRFCDVVEAGFD